MASPTYIYTFNQKKKKNTYIRIQQQKKIRIFSTCSFFTFLVYIEFKLTNVLDMTPKIVPFSEKFTSPSLPIKKPMITINLCKKKKMGKMSLSTCCMCVWVCICYKQIRVRKLVFSCKNIYVNKTLMTIVRERATL